MFQINQLYLPEKVGLSDKVAFSPEKESFPENVGFSPEKNPVYLRKSGSF